MPPPPLPAGDTAPPPPRGRGRAADSGCRSQSSRYSAGLFPPEPVEIREIYCRHITQLRQYISLLDFTLLERFLIFHVTSTYRNKINILKMRLYNLMIFPHHLSVIMFNFLIDTCNHIITFIYHLQVIMLNYTQQ